MVLHSNYLSNKKKIDAPRYYVKRDRTKAEYKKKKKKKTTITRLISSAMAGPSSMIFFFFVETTGKYSERDTNVSEPD